MHACNVKNEVGILFAGILFLFIITFFFSNVFVVDKLHKNVQVRCTDTDPR